MTPRARRVVLLVALCTACGDKGGKGAGDDAGPVVAAAPPPKTSKPGTTAIESLKKVREPRALSFFPPGPVADQVAGYLTDLGQKAGVPFEVREVDRLLQVEEAKRFRVVRDGVVVLVSGELSETVELHTDGAEAEAELARLDAKVARGLARLARGQRQIGLVGHQVADAPRFEVFQQALAMLGFAVVAVVPGKDVPAGAVAIFLDVGAGPTRPAMESIDRHLASGGAALVAVEPRENAALGPLEKRLGLRLARRRGHRRPRAALLAAHPSTRAASRISAGSGVRLTGAGALDEAGAPPAGVSRVITLRSATAPRQAIAAAVEHGRMKAIVIADAGWLSDEVLRSVPGARALLVDIVHWLAGEETMEREGIDAPATGAELTSYPLRTHAVAGARTALWKVAPDGVQGVRFETRGRVLLLDRKQGELWARLERPSPGGAGGSIREFPLGPEARELFAALAEPVPLRAVGPLDATTRARYGLEDGILAVDVSGGATHTLMVGSRVMGGNDRYAADPSANMVVIVPASLIVPLDQSERLALRRVIDLDEKAVSRLVVARGGRTREAVRGADGAWKVPGGGSDEAYLAEEVARAAFRLVPTEFAPAGKVKELTAAGRLSLSAGTAPPVDLELYTRGDEYWIKTPLTSALAHVSPGGARRIAQAIDQLLAPP